MIADPAGKVLRSSAFNDTATSLSTRFDLDSPYCSKYMACDPHAVHRRARENTGGKYGAILMTFVVPRLAAVAGGPIAFDARRHHDRALGPAHRAPPRDLVHGAPAAAAQGRRRLADAADRAHADAM